MKIDWDQMVFPQEKSAVFRENKGHWGGLSNMASGFGLNVNGTEIRTVEALYQACRFPYHPEVQKQIIDQKSPMAAKMISRKQSKLTRSDWESEKNGKQVRVLIMKWCLELKLVDHMDRFGRTLMDASDQGLYIVEHSERDSFWGAKKVNDETLNGQNTLGKLLMELWDEYGTQVREPDESPLTIPPVPIKDFDLFGEPIKEQIGSTRHDKVEPSQLEMKF